MNNAFVVEWSPRQKFNIFASHTYDVVYEDDGKNFKVRRDGVAFLVHYNYFYQESFKPCINHSTGDTYLYPIKSSHDAEFMGSLLKYVQNFQLFHWVQELFDFTSKGDNRAETINNMQETHDIMLKFLAKLDSCNAYRNDYVQGKDYPIKVYELDTTKDVKPCFFVCGYKMRDNNVSPYLYVMLEQKYVDNKDSDLFDFNVKFIGSDKLLSKYISQIPVFDTKQVYQQKRNDFKDRINQGYKDKICRLISSKEFSASLQTYSRKENRWRCSWGHNDCEFYVPEKKRCTNPICLGNHFYTETVSQNRDKEYEAFCKIFGPQIGKLVRNNEFTQDKWHLMPDISNNNFIFAFNDFCKQYGYIFMPYYSNEYCINDCFDPNDHVLHKVQFVENYINHIKIWSRNPNSDVVPYLYDGTVFRIPTEKPEDPKIPCMIARGTRTKSL